MVIDGEVVEVLEEIPVPVNRSPKFSMPFQLPKLSVAQRNPTPEPVIPALSEGRIVNVDPRYPDN
jgi:hypothetical protein